VTADVRVSDSNVVEGIFVGGTDYLRWEDDPFNLNDGKKLYRRLTRDRFEKELSQQMLVPRRLLNVVYSKPVKLGDAIEVPWGFTTSRSGR
jgi:hypothetical protein